MPKITINQDRCKGCFLCIAFCPKGLISKHNGLNSQGIKPVKFSRRSGIPQNAGKESPECTGCSMCAIVCPDCCIEVYK